MAKGVSGMKIETLVSDLHYYTFFKITRFVLQRNFSRYFYIVQTHQKKLLSCVLIFTISIFFPQIKTQKHSKVLQDFYKKLQDSGKAKLLALHRSNLREPNFDYVRLLAELGQEQGFEITYVDIFQV